MGDELAVIIVCPYQHLVEQWVEDIEKFNIKPIIGYSSSPQKDWKKRLSKAVLDQRIRKDKGVFCFTCTNATFANPYVQEQISKIKSPVLLVVDEAHNFGASLKNLSCYFWTSSRTSIHRRVISLREKEKPSRFNQYMQ